MTMKIEFEANTARELFRQIADFIEVGAGASSSTLARKAPPPTGTASAEPDLSSKAPTPAVEALLAQADVPPAEWGKVRRTGKGGRMTQGDAKAYLKDRAPAATAGEAVAALPVKADPGDEQTHADQTLVELDAPVASLDEAKAAMQALYVDKEKGGREVCLKLLSDEQFGVKRISEMDPSKYGPWVAACEKILSEGGNI